jgi:hypothetical protein
MSAALPPNEDPPGGAFGQGRDAAAGLQTWESVTCPAVPSALRQSPAASNGPAANAGPIAGRPLQLYDCGRNQPA